MITRIPLHILKASPAASRANLASLPRSTQAVEAVLRESQAYKYSTKPPPKTYFQPGDSPPPNPTYFQPVESQPADSQSPPPNTPKTYFQTPDSNSTKPGDLRSQLAGGYNAQRAIPPPTQKRSLRPFIWATLFFIIGYSTGYQIIRVVSPPPPLEPGSTADKVVIEVIHKVAENLPIVQSLSSDPDWTSQDAWANTPEEAKKSRLTGGPLGGSRALGGFRRTFYHKTSGETVTVIHMGDSISGFPGATHGGLLATVLDETLGQCAIRQFPARTGVTANLEINYLKPVATSRFYIIRATPVVEGFTDRKGWVSGRVETTNGIVCVEAKALFVVPKKFVLKPISENLEFEK